MSGGSCTPPTPTAAPTPWPSPKAGSGCTCGPGSVTARSSRSAPPRCAAGNATWPPRSARPPLASASPWPCGSSSSPSTKARSTPTRSARSLPPSAADPDLVLRPGTRRALTPEEAGQLLACFPLFWWDHVITLLGTGLRIGELAGLHRRRVHLNQPIPTLQVVDVRYQAGSQFGSGFKPRPKSDASIREIPLAPLVVEAIRSQLPSGADPDVLVFAGPGGGNYVATGTRTVLSRHGVRRMYQTAVKRADLDHLDLRGPHDFRHTFSTWLEDAAIPARVIDELMGHQRNRRGDLDGGSRIGARYRHTTDAMAIRVAGAIQERLTIALRVAEDTPAARMGARRVF